MGFDKNDDRPIVEPAKRTTQVNISMVFAILAFFAIGAALYCWMKYHHV